MLWTTQITIELFGGYITSPGVRSTPNNKQLKQQLLSSSLVAMVLIWVQTKRMKYKEVTVVEPQLYPTIPKSKVRVNVR